MTWKSQPWFSVAVKTEADRVTAVAGSWFENGEPVRGGVITIDPSGKSGPVFRAMADVLLARMRTASVLVAYDAPRVLGALEAEFTAAGKLSEWIGLVASGDRLVVDPLVLVRLKRVGRFWKRRWPDERSHALVNAADRLQVIPASTTDADAIPPSSLAGRVLWHLAEHMPDDAADAAEWLAEKREEQAREYREYRAQRDAERDTQQRGESR